MTDAVVVAVPESGLDAVAARAAARFAPTGAQSARAVPAAARVFLSAPVLIFAARARAAAGLAAVFALAAFPVAGRAVAVVSGPAAVAAEFAAAFALAAFPVAERAVAVVSDPAAVVAGFAAAFALAAFPLDRAFALPAFAAALRPQCRFPPMTGCR